MKSLVAVDLGNSATVERWTNRRSFLKRAMSRNGKSVPSCLTGVDDSTAQSKQTAPEPFRRVRTSAAVLGLALSVGAHGLVLTRASEAAEPVTSEASAANAAEPTSERPPETENAVVLPASAPQTMAPAQLSLGETVVETTAQPVERQTTDEQPVASVSTARSSYSGQVVEHKVRDGQTLWQISRIYDVDASVIAAFNNLSDKSALVVGQILKVPVADRVAAMARLNRLAAVPSQSNDFVIDRADVQSGDRQAFKLKGDIQAVAGSESTPLEELQLEQEQVKSSKSSDSISAKDKELSSNLASAQTAPERRVAATDVVVPAQIATPSAKPKTLVAVNSNYRVSRGDTVVAIARAYGVSIKDLVRANRLTNPNIIRVNQTLVIPAKVATASPAPIFSLQSVVVPAELDESSPALDASQESVVSNGSASTLPARDEVKLTPFAPVGVSRQASPKAHYDYVGNLRSEMVKLREKYNDKVSQSESQVQTPQQVAIVSTSTPESSLSASSEPINPELQPQRRRLVPTQKVAVAPVGSESYDPILSEALGKTVSPDLPAIGAADSYLPNSQGPAKGYIWPARGVLTSGYGWRWGRMHKGIDIAAPVGTPVVAAADGVVTYAKWNSGGYGNLVEITHSNGSTTLYAHNSRLLVSDGQQVAQGQQIAEMGSTGYSTGPHSHFEVHLPGQGAVNPIGYLAKRN